MKTMIENLINGNLREARAQAKGKSKARIFDSLTNEYGFSTRKASHAVIYLKHGGQYNYQAYCDAQ